MPYDYGGESFGRGLQYGQSLAAPFLQAKNVSYERGERAAELATQQRWRTEDITRGARGTTLQAWIARQTARDTLYGNLMMPRQDPVTKEWSTPDAAAAKKTVDAIFPPMPVPRELTEAYGQAPMEEPSDDKTEKIPPGAATGTAEGGGIGIGGMLGLGGAAAAGAYLGLPRFVRALGETPGWTLRFPGMDLPPGIGKLTTESLHASDLSPEVLKLRIPSGQRLPVKLVQEGGVNYPPWHSVKIPPKPGILGRIGGWFGKTLKSVRGTGIPRGGMAGTGFINPRDIREMWEARERELDEKDDRARQQRRLEYYPRTSIQPETIPGYPQERRSVARRNWYRDLILRGGE